MLFDDGRKVLYDVKDDLADKDGKNYVYIVTDGEETCGGDPVQAAKDLLPVDEHCRFAVRQEPEQVKDRYSCIYAA